jgi:hypothetical protein
VSTRLAAVVMAMASVVARAGAESREPADVESVLASRRLEPASAPRPADLLAARLIWIDPARVAVGLEAAAREEARSLLEKMGASVSWRRGSAGEISRSGEVRVIFLDRGAARPEGIPVLGATPSRFESAPFVWIHVPNVRRAIGLRPQGPPAARDPLEARSLAIALGRVVAHEVVHALAPSVPHGTGLMSARLTRRQLTAATLSIDPVVGFAVRAALRGELSPAPADAGLVAAAATAGKTGQ